MEKKTCFFVSLYWQDQTYFLVTGNVKQKTITK